jgi:hypothetical protein
VVLGLFHRFTVVTLDPFHGDRIHRHLAQCQTIERTHGHVIVQFVDHIEIVFFHFTPTARDNFPIHYDVDVEADFRAKHFANVVLVDGVRFGLFALEIFAAHGAFVCGIGIERDVWMR